MHIYIYIYIYIYTYIVRRPRGGRAASRAHRGTGLRRWNSNSSSNDFSSNSSSGNTSSSNTDSVYPIVLTDGIGPPDPQPLTFK